MVNLKILKLKPLVIVLQLWIFTYFPALCGHLSPDVATYADPRLAAQYTSRVRTPTQSGALPDFRRLLDHHRVDEVSFIVSDLFDVSVKLSVYIFKFS